ncbi:MAG TPA: DUF6152 family protein [Bryobacteraceae bacterium]|jgi:hypothetical protein
MRMLLPLLLIPASAWAHHSFAAEFDQKQVVKLKGTVIQFEWVNPHAMIHLAVKNADGTTTNWKIEGNTPNSLLRAGLNKKSLEAGTEIVVVGYRARSGDHIASGSAIAFQDGRKMALGSSGDQNGKALLDWVASDEELWKLQLAALNANQ